ncbi:hypothetical protein CVM73_37045 [Bradyrhizobium forestalis]|uniref:Uncharacterized protein n=1 Tax=Bradyrhizobium forestalis TaxID=1419263 RepID=A0A2M8QXL6_9BRAD|nr:hypothetical protein CVM73_37045 [Bradyrhizobium forestalis]
MAKKKMERPGIFSVRQFSLGISTGVSSDTVRYEHLLGPLDVRVLMEKSSRELLMPFQRAPSDRHDEIASRKQLQLRV